MPGFQLRIGDLPFDEMASALQKMIRRAKEREALCLGRYMHNKGFGGYLARRLCVIAQEDIGLADLTAVQFTYTSCMNWEWSERQAGKGKTAYAQLALAIIVLCRAKKNREASMAEWWTLEMLWPEDPVAEWQPQEIIKKHAETILDGHTQRGRQRLKKEDPDVGALQLKVWKFLTLGAHVTPLVHDEGNEADGIPPDWYSKEICKLYEISFKEYNIDAAKEAK